MEIGHDFSPAGDADLARGRFEQLENQLALFQKALGHDLPNRMMALQGLVRQAEEELAPDARDRIGRLAVFARQADKRMRALAELGHLCQKPGPVETMDLGELTSEAAIEARVLFRNQTVDYHLQQDMPVVTTNRAPLYRVLSQVLRNAFQAAAPGRTLRIDIGASRVETGGTQFQVRDDGRGMTALQLGQARATLAGEPYGVAGLGLALVRQVVLGWRGAVRIDSEPGRGTLITVLAQNLVNELHVL